MLVYLTIVPVALLVAYSQLMVKYRATSIAMDPGASWIRSVLRYLTDPWIASAYAAALIASFAWLFVVTRMPLTIAFPAYIGLTFILVALGGLIFLDEAVGPTRLVAMGLIFAGITLGMLADGQ